MTAKRANKAKSTPAEIIGDPNDYTPGELEAMTASPPDDELPDDELPDEIPDDELPDEVIETDLPERETYTAKQAATRIGTDAKTLRKFFRSAASTVEPCGQGGRYEFAAGDMPQIKAEFIKWTGNKGTGAAGAKGSGKTKASTGRTIPKNVVAIEEDDEILELDDDEELEELELEPATDELDAIEDEEEEED